MTMIFALTAEQGWLSHRKVRITMAAYSITATMDLKNLISEAREVAQAMNEFVDALERIENKYGTKAEDEEYEMVDLGNGLFEKRIKD